jgi:hypothetical protein
MNAILRIAIILFLAGLGSSWQAVAADSASTTNSLVGAYICDEVKIHLLINLDGTYDASLEQPPVTRHETGIWETKGKDIILRCRGGGIGFSIQRLQPDREVAGHLLWISPADGGSGAIEHPIFHRE